MSKEMKVTMGTMLNNVRGTTPLVHNITNYVTVNDVANVLLACGGSPIMSDDIEDVEDIQTICGGLNINIGTLNQQTIPSMFAAAKKANELGHIVLLDPVGAGASKLRTKTALGILKERKVSILRGNSSEVKALMQGSATTRGVDADDADQVDDGTLAFQVNSLKQYASELDGIVAITGAIDLVCDANTCYVIRNGRPEMSRITGTGCQLSGMMTAFVVANPENQLLAAASAVCLMGLAGELAMSRLENGEGNSTYRNRIIDAICNMTSEQLDEGAIYEIR